MLTLFLAVFLATSQHSLSREIHKPNLTEATECLGVEASFDRHWFHSLLIGKSVPKTPSSDKIVHYFVDIDHRKTINVKLICSNKEDTMNISHVELALPKKDREWCQDIADLASTKNRCETEANPCDCCTKPHSGLESLCTISDLDLQKRFKENCDGVSECQVPVEAKDISTQCSTDLDYECMTRAGSQCLARWVTVMFLCDATIKDTPTTTTKTSTTVTKTPTLKETLPRTTNPSSNQPSVVITDDTTTTIQTTPATKTVNPMTNPSIKLTTLMQRPSQHAGTSLNEFSTTSQQTSVTSVAMQEDKFTREDTGSQETSSAYTQITESKGLFQDMSYQFFIGIGAGLIAAIILLICVLLFIFRKKLTPTTAKKETTRSSTIPLPMGTPNMSTKSDDDDNLERTSITTQVQVENTSTTTMVTPDTPEEQHRDVTRSAVYDIARCQNKAVQNVYLVEEIPRGRPVSDGILFTHGKNVPEYRSGVPFQAQYFVNKELKDARQRITRSTTVLDDHHYEEVGCPVDHCLLEEKVDATTVTPGDGTMRENRPARLYEEITPGDKPCTVRSNLTDRSSLTSDAKSTSTFYDKESNRNTEGTNATENTSNQQLIKKGNIRPQLKPKLMNINTGVKIPSPNGDWEWEGCGTYHDEHLNKRGYHNQGYLPEGHTHTFENREKILLPLKSTENNTTSSDEDSYSEPESFPEKTEGIINKQVLSESNHDKEDVVEKEKCVKDDVLVYHVPRASKLTEEQLCLAVPESLPTSLDQCRSLLNASKPHEFNEHFDRLGQDKKHSSVLKDQFSCVPTGRNFSTPDRRAPTYDKSKAADSQTTNKFPVPTKSEEIKKVPPKPGVKPKPKEVTTNQKPENKHSNKTANTGPEVKPKPKGQKTGIIMSPLTDTAVNNTNIKEKAEIENTEIKPGQGAFVENEKDINSKERHMWHPELNMMAKQRTHCDKDLNQGVVKSFGLQKIQEDYTDQSVDWEDNSPYMKAIPQTLRFVDDTWKNTRHEEEQANGGYMRSVNINQTEATKEDKSITGPNSEPQRKQSRARSLQGKLLPRRFSFAKKRRPKSFSFAEGSSSGYMLPTRLMQSQTQEDPLMFLELSSSSKDDSFFTHIPRSGTVPEGDYSYAYAHFAIEGRKREPPKNESKV